MLVVLPPSEAKAAPPQGGDRVDLSSLSFPELTSAREQVLRALMATSARADALTRLRVGQSAGAEVERNTRLTEVPVLPVLELYRGDLYDALDAATLGPEARRRAAERVVVVSALWGALRPGDAVPSYRLDVCSDLVGLGGLEPFWRTVLPEVLTRARGDGLLVDLRSSSFLAVGRPDPVGTVNVRVVRAGGGRGAAGTVAKRVRGELTRHLLTGGMDPATPEELADVLSERWRAALVPPARSGRDPAVVEVQA